MRRAMKGAEPKENHTPDITFNRRLSDHTQGWVILSPQKLQAELNLA